MKNITSFIQIFPIVTCIFFLGIGATTGYTLMGTTTFSSSNLATSLTDENGTGTVCFGTNTTLTTPTIGDFTNATHSHLNAAGGGTITIAAISDLPVLISGSFVPTAVSTANLDASAGGASYFLRVGSVVNVSGVFTADPTTTLTLTTLTLTLPVSATTTFSATNQAAGTSASSASTASGRVNSTSSASTVTISFTPVATANGSYGYQYQYQIQ